MNPYPVKNGTSAHSRGGRTDRQKVSFEINIPQSITLEFNPPDEPREGAWGPQFMYFVDAGERIAFLEPDVHDQIVQLGARAGDVVCIVKRKAGRATRWEVNIPDAAEPAAPPAPALRSQPRPGAAVIQREPDFLDTIPPPPPPRSEPPPANLMTVALREAIEAAEESGFAKAAHAEDIRALAITIYIQRAGGRR